MELREPAPTDQQNLSRLVRDAYPEYDFPGINAEVRHQAQMFVADMDGQPIGFSLVSMVDYGMGPPYSEILEVVVDADHRRQGVASALIEKCIDWVADQGAPIVYLNAREDEARRLYARLGFVGKPEERMFRHTSSHEPVQSTNEEQPGRRTGINVGDIRTY